MFLYHSVKALGSLRIDSGKIRVLYRQINDRIAAFTYKMIVWAGIVIKMVNTQHPKAVLGDHASLCQLVKVPIHSAKTDIGKSLLHTGIDGLRSWVIFAGL